MKCVPKPIVSLLGKFSVFCCLVFGLQTNAQAQTWKVRIDYEKLEMEYGTLEDGAGISLSMIEADITADPGLFRYMPDPANVNMSQTIIDGSGLNNNGFSPHAGSMALQFFGNGSIAQGGTGGTVFEANDYINRMLALDTGFDPLVQNFQVQNHSWIGNVGTSASQIALAEDILQRFDFMINRDDITVAVGLNNNSGNSQPQLMAHSYNAIAVGRTDGNHSRGQTTVYGAGRVKPDVVNPLSTTSSATARASSVLAVLHEKAVNEGNADASRSVVMKSVLMAGATKDEFPGWSRTTTRPLDEVFGAGEINIYNSYKILEAGETDGSLTVPAGATIDTAGFDYGESLDSNDAMYYNFEIGPGEKWDDVSLMLNWNIDITDTDGGAAFDPTSSLADFSLRLYDSTSSPLDMLLDSSLSTVDNVEHIFVERLEEGLYTIEITTDTTHDFAFSWYARAVPEPSSALLLMAASSFIALRRRHSV